MAAADILALSDELSRSDLSRSDLSRSDLSAALRIKGSATDTIDLRGSSFYLWDVLLELPRLKTLAVDPGVLPDSIRQRLPTDLKISEESRRD